MPTYPEPRSILNNLSLSEGRIVAEGESAPLLEVGYQNGAGWCLEVRYDLCCDRFRSNALTGVQQPLGQTTLHQTETTIECVGGRQQRLVFDRLDGSFRILENGVELFTSSQAPFRCHLQPVELFENVMSLKVTDMEERMGSVRRKTKYESHMVRFQYPKPAGLVLGLPGQAGEMNRNGYRFQLYNTDPICLLLPDRRPLYSSWPILLHRSADGESWVAIFHDNPSRTFVDVGDFYPDAVTFESLMNNTRVFICSGSTLSEVSHRLSVFLGSACPVPLWAFGYQQCRWSYMSSAEVQKVARRFREENIPCDAIYFDIDHMDEFRVFSQDSHTFGDLKECVKALREMDYRSVAIVDPGVKAVRGFIVYDVMQRLPHLKNHDGTPFLAQVWPGPSLLPDFGAPETRARWAEFQREWLEKFQFDGVWNDMNEPSNFDGQNESTSRAYNARGLHKAEHNVYGLGMAQASREGVALHSPNERGLVITRASYPGIQQHAIIWHGDNQAWWEHLQLAIDTAVSYSLCGAYFTGPDVPGFSGSPSDDLAVRFFQLGAFMPLFRGHSIYYSKDKEPYAYNQNTKNLIVEAIKFRYSLTREWYTGFARSHELQQPPLLPVLTAGGESLVRSQFLLFDKFLVAPVVHRDVEKIAVYLPPGGWYRFNDSTQMLEGDSWILEPTPLNHIPLFVRAGSIVIRNTVARTVEKTLEGPEYLQVYPKCDGSAFGWWFDDDGVSLDRCKGKRVFRTVSCGLETMREAIRESFAGNQESGTID